MTGQAHTVGRETRCRVGMAGAALDGTDRHVWRRRQAERGLAIVTAYAIGVGWLMHISGASPRRERSRGLGMADDAVLTACRNVICKGSRAQRSLAALGGVRTVMTRIAPARADGAVIHRVGGKARRRIGMAIAALDSRCGDMRRRGHASRGTAVVTTHAICIRRLVNIGATRPTRVSVRCLGMAGDAILAPGGDVAWIVRCTVSTR